MMIILHRADSGEDLAVALDKVTCAYRHNGEWTVRIEDYGTFAIRESPFEVAALVNNSCVPPEPDDDGRTRLIELEEGKDDADQTPP